MNKIPKLSIIVPVYNVEPFLQECLNSLLQQNFQDFECILVDDGSTDGSGKLCDEFCGNHKQFRVIHQKNMGVSVAREKGLQHANGEFVSFVDSDDMVAKDMFKVLIVSIMNDNEVDVSICNFESFADAAFQHEMEKFCPEYLDGKTALARMLEQDGFHWSLWGKVYRKRFFIEGTDIDKWPESYGEDIYINWELFHKARKVVYHDFLGYFYRVHNYSLMRQLFTFKQIVYLHIWLQMYDEAASSCCDNKRIIQAIETWFMREGLHLIWQAWHIRLDSSSRKLLENYCCRIKEILSGIDAWLPQQKKLYAWAVSDESHIKKRLENERECLLEFQRKYKFIWIYGTGYVCRDIVLLMQNAGVDFTGFVVSQGGGEAIFDKPVYSLDKLLLENKSNMGFVLAMKRSYCDEVIQNLLSKGIQENQYINMGMVSYYYDNP